MIIIRCHDRTVHSQGFRTLHFSPLKRPTIMLHFFTKMHGFPHPHKKVTKMLGKCSYIWAFYYKGD